MRTSVFRPVLGLVLSTAMLAACSAPTQSTPQAPPQSQTQAPAAAGAAAPAQTGPMTKISFGLPVANSIEFLPAFIARDQGFFAKHGLDVTVTGFTGGPALQQAVSAGSIQVGVDNVTGLGLAIAKGAPIRIIATTSKHLTMSLIVSDKSGITKVADLKGKTIGVTAHGAITDWLGVQVAKQQGWDPESGITRVPLGGLQEQLAALRSGQTQAFVWTPEPGLALEESKEGKILVKFGDVLPDYAYFSLEARSDFLKDHPDQVRGAVAGWFEGVAWMKSHRAESIAMIQKLMQYDAFVAEKGYDLLIGILSDDGAPDRKAVEATLKSLAELGGLKQIPTFEDVFTTGFTPK